MPTHCWTSPWAVTNLKLSVDTGNGTYATWVNKTYDWMADIGLIGGNKQYSVFDGTDENNNCTSIDHIQWSYSAGMTLNTAAVMWNATGNDIWQTRAQGVWDASSVSVLSLRHLKQEHR